MNTRIHEAARTHWMAIAIALVVGLVYASHHFFIPLFFLDPSKEVYEPLAGDYGDEMLLYGPRAHDAFLNFGIRGDFSLAEYPRSPAILPILNPLLLGGLGKVFGSMHRGIIASDILFPSLIFFILYLFMCEVGTGRFASVFFSTMFVISPQFGISTPPISSFHLRTLAQTVFPFLIKNEALSFSHFDEPKLTFVFFVFFLYTCMRALKHQNRNDIETVTKHCHSRASGNPDPFLFCGSPLSRGQAWIPACAGMTSGERIEFFYGRIIFAGISLGILFYTYLYDWATAVTSLCLMAIYFFIAKDYRRLKIVAAIIAIGLCVSSYYWINLLLVKNLPTGQDVIARLGGEFSHQLRFVTVWKSYTRAIILVALLWIYTHGRVKEMVMVLSAILLSYIIVVNAQIVTGFNIQPDHWYRVQFLPIAVAVYVLLYTLYQRYGPYPIKKYASIARTGFFIYFFCAALAGQYAYSRTHAHLFSTPVEYQESFEWLNRNTEIGSVVGTLSFRGNLHLQMRTANHIFTPFGLSTIASEDELWNRFMVMARLWGIDGKGFASLVNQEGGAYYLFGDQYGIHTFDAAFFPYNWRVPDGILAEKIKIYETMLMKKDMSLSNVRLDYLFVDRNEFPQWKEPRKLVPSIANVFDNGRVAIYSLR